MIKKSGFRRMNKRLRSIATMHRRMGAPARETGEIIGTRVMVYAPRRGSRYRRTFTLRGSMIWRIVNKVRGVIIRAGSRGAVSPRGKRYDPFVKDTRRQAGIHRGFWATYRQDLDFTKGAILNVWRRWIARQI